MGRLPVDGQIYGQPLYVPGIGGKNVVYVATENNKVYAFDADNITKSPLAPIPPIWERDLEAAWNPASSSCGNSVKPYGINSTPVIDPAPRHRFDAAALLISALMAAPA